MGGMNGGWMRSMDGVGGLDGGLVEGRRVGKVEKSSISVFQGYLNKILQIWWLRTIET